MKALALVDSPGHVCCRYRIQAFAPALRRAGIDLEIVPLASGLLPRALQVTRLPRFDTIILQRKLLPHWQLKSLRAHTRQLVFDFDDAVLYRDSYDPRGPICAKRRRRFEETVRACDTIVAGNDFLADCALRSGARPERVRVIPTCVDTERYPLVNASVSKPGIDLVWIGSSSTLQGLESEQGVWDRLAREVPGVRLRLIADRTAELGSMPVEYITWRQDTEATEVAAGEIGVSMVPDDLWSLGKCGLKVLQYQAAGLPVLASPVGVHKEMIESGVTGWLPRSAAEWVDAVRTLANDDLLRHEMGRAGRASVEANYSVKAWEATFVATLAGASSVPPPNLIKSATSLAPRRRLGNGPVSPPNSRSREPRINHGVRAQEGSDGESG
jgi:glycosyltransferase involved in cell wall biosynthesis